MDHPVNLVSPRSDTLAPGPEAGANHRLSAFQATKLPCHDQARCRAARDL
jgi:hypothetical protein